MALKQLASDLGSSITGNAKKAILILHDLSGGGQTGGMANRLSTIESALNSAASATGGLTSASINQASQTAGIGTARVLHVQYNPSSITLSANASAMQMKHLQSNVDEAIPNVMVLPPSVLMRVDLVFDAVNNKDAFMFEKFRVSVSDAAAIGAGIAKAAKSSPFSVQAQTNGLICALMQNSTRYVTFRWADMSFTGEIKEVSARYTMFSVSGRPIRSTVTLQIAQQVSERGDVQYWNNAFDKCFGTQNTGGATSSVSAGQKVGNLLNIGF